MPRSLQPRFSVFIEEQEVTNSVKTPIVYHEQPDVISNLTFTLSGRNYFIPSGSSGDSLSPAHVVKLGNSIRCYMGTLNTDNFREVFKGAVKNLNPVFDEKGLVSVTVTCAGVTFFASQKRVVGIYPSPNASRTWAQKSPLKASEVVEGIASEIGMSVKEISLAQDVEYTFNNPLSQYKETDWAFLRRFARKLGANVWGEHLPNEGGEKLFFVDRSAQMNTDETVGFIHPLRKNDGSYEFSETNQGEKILFDIEVEQDLIAAEANVRTVQKFDRGTGENILVFQTRKEDSQGQVMIKYYKMEVDESKLPSDPVEREKVKNIAQNLGGQNQYTLEDVEQYFKPADFIRDDYSVIDKPWFGITITGRIDGDVNLRAKRSYPVRGIGRYGTETLEENYYLSELKHVIDGEGFITEVTLRL